MNFPGTKHQPKPKFAFNFINYILSFDTAEGGEMGRLASGDANSINAFYLIITILRPLTNQIKRLQINFHNEHHQ